MGSPKPKRLREEFEYDYHSKHRDRAPRTGSAAAHPRQRDASRLGCWIDLFDLPAFQGERRRFFGPIRLDAATLGLDHASGGLSVRVGKEADLKIVLTDGDAQVLHGGEVLASLETRKLLSMEVTR